MASCGEIHLVKENGTPLYDVLFILWLIVVGKLAHKKCV